MATEKRLIDANDALNRFEKTDSVSYFGEWYTLNDTVADILKNTPTVDAVEVVRCKDCVHRHTRGSCHGRPLDWYCPDGIRRNDVVAEK